MAMSLLSLAGCNQINEDTSKKVVSLLEEKYGEQFVVVKIGNRLNTDTVTTYCHSEKRNDLMFTATMGNDGKIITDDYISRIIGRELEDEIISKFSAEGIDVQPYASIYNPNGMPEKADVTLKNFVSQYHPEMFIVNMVLSDKLDAPESSEQLQSVMKELFTLVSVPLQFKVKVIPADMFEECREFMKDEPIYNETQIKQNFTIMSAFAVNSDSQGVNMVEDFYSNQ